MRVIVQLIDAESGNHLWAERFDKPLPISSTCRTKSSRGLRTRSMPRSPRRRRGARSGPRTPTSMDLCFQGLARLNKGFTPVNLAAARRLYERALALDPANVFALVGVAAVDVTVAITFFPTIKPRGLPPLKKL